MKDNRLHIEKNTIQEKQFWDRFAKPYAPIQEHTNRGLYGSLEN